MKENGGPSPRVLSVEDQSASISSMMKELEFQGCHLDCAPDGDSAGDFLDKEDYDLLFVDQRFPYGGQFDDEAGERLIGSLRTGRFGPRNRAVPYALVTADRRWVSPKTSVNHDGCLAILTKTSSLRTFAVSLCQRAVPSWIPYDSLRVDQEEDRRPATLFRYRQDNPHLGDGRTDIAFRVPRWDGASAIVSVPLVHLSDDVLEDLERPVELVLVDATIDASAKTPDELVPANFGLSMQLDEGDDLDNFGAP